jgi:hypothetical protein
MVQIDSILISDSVFEKKFSCDLHACKGACCVAGDSGAPLETEECKILDKEYNKIKSYMQPAGCEAVEKQGKYVRDIEFDMTTPLINGKECVYTIFDENGTAFCAVEKAWFDKKIKFRKPISCFLYPIRVKQFPNVTAVNYDEWAICKSALVKGKSENKSVFQFLKEPLIQKFGKEFYLKMEIYSKNLESFNKK